MSHFTGSSYIPFPRRSSFNDDVVIDVWRFFRHTNIRSSPDTTIKFRNGRGLFTFNFNPPYSYGDQVIIMMGSIDKECRLVGRIPIALDDEDQLTLDFRAIFVHYSPGFEETVMIPVPSSFFQDDFFQFTTLHHLSSPHNQPLSHTYPPDTPITPHIHQQLQEPIPPQIGTWRSCMINHLMQIIFLALLLVVIAILAIVTTFAGHT
ncbi:hypothetical protein M422DRAFT_276004 [Sphaerobolus stellatus SS14]|uniref:Uncharacterized protein n=1 Tax=Sphaerobolus stellatus (strain SS14) TaxID=990650 RepID=A0A0C9T3H6_SPHS4|nr:hypothetical protein M422DRAFT_276004 [Sphaerobolus stellatus SS14]